MNKRFETQKIMDNRRKIMIAGTHSGCGKTTVTCAIVQTLVNRGMPVTVYKCGPDYIDPLFHKKIIGADSCNLDSFFCDKNTLNFLLNRERETIAVIEGVMGCYDGINSEYSSIQTAVDTSTPVVLVIDCKGMSTSIAAVMKGFLSYRKPNNIIGFIFNRLPDKLVNAVKEYCNEQNIEYFGKLPYCKDCVIPSRHLGLDCDIETVDLKRKMNRLSELVEKNVLIDKLIEYSLSEIVNYTCPNIDTVSKTPLRIAVSNDEAFCFQYRDNMELLKRMGCEIVEFSPLSDKKLPENIYGLILTGGYPELYADQLSRNTELLSEIKTKVTLGLPTIAECGGFMYLHESLETEKGKYYPMVGAVKGKCFRNERLQQFGYISLKAKKDNLFCKKGEEMKAHEFHYWNSTNSGNGFEAKKINGDSCWECSHSSPSLYAGYPHLYFYSNPEYAENFVKKVKEFKENGKNKINSSS